MPPCALFSPHPYTTTLLLLPPFPPPHHLLLLHRPKTTTRRRRRRFICLASSTNPQPNGFDGLSWEKIASSLGRNSSRVIGPVGDAVKKETGFDFEETGRTVWGQVGKCREEVARVWRVVGPEFIRWNSWENWKDIRNWEPKRIAALLLYTIAFSASCWKIHAEFEASRNSLARKELTEAYMETLIPEPTPANVRMMKKGIWRKSMPKGLKMKKYIEGPDGTLVHDSSFVGEDAWDDDLDQPSKTLKEIIYSNDDLTAEEKKTVTRELGLAAVGEEVKSTWRERLCAWEKILKEEKFIEQLNSLRSRYVVDFDMKEVEDSLHKDVVETVSKTHGGRALWISKRWWRYRPKLPYTYFLQKLDSSEVAAVVFTEDLKRLYVTMKEGFPLEYIVEIPLDPYLFETISNSGVEVDLLQKRQIHYLLRVVVALLPGMLILLLIRESLLLLFITTKRCLARFYQLLIDMKDTENLVLPDGETGGAKSMAREVILGGDVWDLVDELTIYMENPMQYYEKGVKFVRGVLLSGPPGTGKTLFARTLAKKCGLPFVFASAAEFTEESGPRKISKLFTIARRNAPSFIFVDEIDAIAGRHVKKDKFRKSSYKALIAQLDGEKERTGYDRFSPHQAVIFICATNIPSELDQQFVRLGRIDRRLHIALPSAEQRVQIFGLHSAGKQLAEDVDFEKVVYRTVGYSGADIRNLINEAGLMAVRRGHTMINQQDIIDVLDKQLLEAMGVLLTEEEQRKSELNVPLEKKRLLAVHEAGHIVLAHLFPRFDRHTFSQIVLGGKETAMSVFYPREDIRRQPYTNVGYLLMQMVVAHGGRCAEQLVFGDITEGGTDDLAKITKIARELVISPTNPRLGPARLTKKMVCTNSSKNSRRGAVIKYKWDDRRVIRSEMSIEVSELFVRELTRYIDETEELAMKGLRDNRHILDAIVSKLLEKSRLSGLEVEEMVKGLSPIMFEDFMEPFRINLDEEGPPPNNERHSFRSGPPIESPWSPSLDVYPAPLHRC